LRTSTHHFSVDIDYSLRLRMCVCTCVSACMYEMYFRSRFHFNYEELWCWCITRGNTEFLDSLPCIEFGILDDGQGPEIQQSQVQFYSIRLL
jgi:hypothetical protein